jgi:hypothetical protein
MAGLAYWDKRGVQYNMEPSFANVWFALLAPDGSSALPSHFAFTDFDGNTKVYGADMRPGLTWNGSEYAVVWRERVGSTSSVMFQRVKPDGTLLGNRINITTSTPGGATSAGYPFAPRVAFLPGVGYAVVTVCGYSSAYVDFQFIGMDGTTPQPKQNLKAVSSASIDEQSMLFEGLGGEWQIMALADGNLHLTRLNADGSMTAPIERVATEAHVSPTLAVDPQGLVSAWTTYGTPTYTHDLVIARGERLEAQHVVWARTDLNRMTEPRVVVTDNVLSLFLAERDGASGYHRVSVRRYLLSSDIGVPPTPITDWTHALDTLTADIESGYSAVAVDDKLLAAWVDTRWGTARELYAASVDVLSCP